MPSGRLFGVLLAALILSGAAGLTYQVLWLRLLSIVFGVTAYAASTVLAGFMAGLAVGSAIAGRAASRSTRPLRLFAAAEAGIAVTALASEQVLLALSGWVGSALAGIADDAAALTAIRFAAAFAVLLGPTALMGATLPLVAASTLVRADATGARISAAYAANTAGAIAGAVLTGVWLIGSLGLSASFRLAAAANLLAAATALWLSRGEPRPGAAVSPVAADPVVAGPSAPPESFPGAAAPSVRRAVLIVLALSGLASLALEVVWFRILVLFIPATTYAFTTMLAAVLGGIAAGSWIAARLLRRDRDWLAVLTGVHAATGVAALLSVAALAWTYGRGWRTSGQIQASVLTIAPAAILMGIAFPLALRLWARFGRGAATGAGDLPRDLGSAYAVNVCGAIAGAVLGGFVLLPGLGSRGSLIACAALYPACALVLALAWPRRRRAAAAVAVAGLAFAAAAALVPDPYQASMSRRHGAGDRVLWREEGVQTTVSVHRQPGGTHVLYLNGLHQANDTPEMLRTHRLIGHLPMVLHPEPRRALVIGLGGGATAGAVSQHPGVEVDVVELSDSVRKGAAYFSHVNYDVLRRPNVRLRVDDGRNYLLTTQARYDVVTADIIQPIHAGAGLLYSVEYYRLARAVLADDGVMLQWVGHRPDSQYKLILRSFQSVFPYTTVWADGTLLVGSMRPLAVSRAAFERHRRDPDARVALDAIGLASFEALLGAYVAGPEGARAFAGAGDVLSDDQPRLEYHRSLPAERGDVDLTALRRDPEPLAIVD